MPRYAFTPNKEYAGRVHAVWPKSVENARLNLLRIEFEIFQYLDGSRLQSTGKIACRDIVIGPAINVNADEGVLPFISALDVRRPDVVKHWLASAGRWVKIVFGTVQEREQRNGFKRIFPIDVRQREVEEYPYNLDSNWVKVAEAADDLERSESTIRRLVDRLEIDFGERLVRRTRPEGGGHRIINLILLRNLI